MLRGTLTCLSQTGEGFLLTFTEQTRTNYMCFRFPFKVPSPSHHARISGTSADRQFCNKRWDTWFGGTLVSRNRDFKNTTFYCRDFKTSRIKNIILFNYGMLEVPARKPLAEVPARTPPIVAHLLSRL